MKNAKDRGPNQTARQPGDHHLRTLFPRKCTSVDWRAVDTEKARCGTRWRGKSVEYASWCVGGELVYCCIRKIEFRTMGVWTASKKEGCFHHRPELRASSVGL